jgi:hypothetical protein
VVGTGVIVIPPTHGVDISITTALIGITNSLMHPVKLDAYQLVMVDGAVSSLALDMTIVYSQVIAMDVIYNYNVPTYLNT